MLIQADLGIDTAVEITERLAKDRFDKEISVDEIRQVLRDEVARVLDPVAQPLALEGGHSPHVILMVGVNGSGKTTTIGKLTAKLTAEGKKKWCWPRAIRSARRLWNNFRFGVNAQTLR